MTHDRPIHKTGVPGPAQGAGLSPSPEPGGSRCCRGGGGEEGQLPLTAWRLAGALYYLSKEGKIIFLKRTSPRALWSPCLVSIALLQKPLFRPWGFASSLPGSGEKHGPLQGPVSSSVLLGKEGPAVAFIQVYSQIREAAQCSPEVPSKCRYVGPRLPHLQNLNKARSRGLVHSLLALCKQQPGGTAWECSDYPVFVQGVRASPSLCLDFIQ